MGRGSGLRQWYVGRGGGVGNGWWGDPSRTPRHSPQGSARRFHHTGCADPGGAAGLPHAIVAWPTVTGPCRRCALPRKVVSIVGARPAAPTEATARSVTANTDGRLPLPTKCTCANAASRPWAARQISRRKPRTLVSRQEDGGRFTGTPPRRS